MKIVILLMAAFFLVGIEKLHAGAGNSMTGTVEYQKVYRSTEIINTPKLNHYVLTSSGVFVAGIVVSSPGIGSTFALFDSSSAAKVDGNFIHITSITTGRDSGVEAGAFIPIWKNFGKYGCMINESTGTGRAVIRVLFDFFSGTEDRTLGD